MSRADHVAVSRILAGKMRLRDAHPDDRDGAFLHLYLTEGLGADEIAYRLRTNPTAPRRVLAQHAEREARRAQRRAA